MLTTRQSRMTGDTDTSLLPVHVHEPALQAAARRTEHLKNTQKKILFHFPTKDEHTGRQNISPNDFTLTVKIFKGEELKIGCD